MTPAQYDAWYDSPRGRWVGETEFRLLYRLLGWQPGETLLDVGCGTGWFTRRFATAGLVVTGLDNDADRLAYAHSRGGSERYLKADALALPFPDASFDIVVSVTALCFVPDWRRALAEMARVARRRMVLGLLNRTSLLWLDKGRAGGRGAYRGARWDTVAEVRAALAGLPVGRPVSLTAVFLPGGSATARWLEPWLPGRLSWGGFLGVAADISRESRHRHPEYLRMHAACQITSCLPRRSPPPSCYPLAPAAPVGLERTWRQPGVVTRSPQGLKSE